MPVRFRWIPMRSEHMRPSFRIAQAVALVAFCFLVTRPAFGDPMIFVEPSSLNVSGQAGFSLEIRISNVTDLAAFQFDVGFDPGVLSAISPAEGTFLPGGGLTFFIPGVVDDVGGTIGGTADTLIGFGSGVSGNGVLATLSFTAVGSGTSAITLFNVLLLDSNLYGIEPTIQNGSVDVSGISAAVPEPSTVLLFGTVLLGSSFLARKRRRGKS
jgi:hypothetical protein